MSHREQANTKRRMSLATFSACTIDRNEKKKKQESKNAQKMANHVESPSVTGTDIHETHR